MKKTLTRPLAGALERRNEMRFQIKEMTRRGTLLALLAVALLALGAGCGSDEAAGDLSAAPNRENGGSGVGQSGAQDFGRFRAIVEAGEVPAPNTLDAVGFFNEHKFELPDPDCGENVCMHGMFGVWGNMINGANCTLAMLGFNTPIDADDYERPPLNMAIAVDVSGSMAGTPISAVRVGLSKMVDRLQPKDEVTLVTYSTEAEVAIVSTPDSDPDREQLRAMINGLEAVGGTNIYDGLRAALEEVDNRRDPNRQNRVILLSDGVATEGIQNRDRILNLGESYSEDGIGITTIGVGEEFDIELMQKLSESGAGNFYFIEDFDTVTEVFEEEVDTFLVPVAEEVNIEFDVAEGYRFRAAYGTRTWEGESDGARIYIPGLFIATRESVEDVGPGGGRRGGGGAILFEVVPTTDPDELTDIPAGAPIGQLTMTYRMPGTEETVTQQATIFNTLAPGDTPDTGEFDNVMVEKAFVALNIYVGFKMATERYVSGAPNQAVGILIPLRDNVEGWLEENEDVDIEDDLETLNLLIATLEAEGATQPTREPPEPWPAGD